MAVVGQAFYCVQGEDVVILFAPDGAPINITGWSLRWQLRPADGSPTVSASKDNAGTGGLAIVDPLNGLIQLTINKADTLALLLQTSPWYWELRRFDSGASTSLAKGTLLIDAANATP